MRFKRVRKGAFRSRVVIYIKLKAYCWKGNRARFFTKKCLIQIGIS